VPIRVSVVENTARSVRLGAGYNTDTGAGVEARYEDNVTFRPGWRSRSVLRLDQREQLAGSELYLLPIFGGLQPRLDAQIKQTDIQNEVTSTGLIAARLARPGFSSEWSIALELRHERKETGGLLISEVTSTPVNFSWTRRVLDDVLYPRKGFVVNLQAGGGLLEGPGVTDDRYTRVYGKANAYWPIGARATLILRGEIGAVQGASRQYVPSDYLFRAGGSQSVRGYEYGKLGIEQNGAIVPGRYIGVASVELSQPVTAEWGVAAFFDAGNVVDHRRDFSAERGYGVGVRWKSPLGPLNVDLAYGEAEKEFRLHFSVGITF
jgi:translocation and assembly module TamA